MTEPKGYQKKYEVFAQKIDKALQQGKGDRLFDVDEETQEAIYKPGEIPPYWQAILKRFGGQRIMSLAMTFGIVVPEFTMYDYVMFAVEDKAGFETINIWGTQGSKKSCYTLYISNWVYQDWDVVLKEMVLVPDASGLSEDYKERGFIQKLQSLSKERLKPLLAWDDFTVGMPSSTFKTDIAIYGAIDSAWAAIRTKTKVMVLNCPLIDRLGKNVKDNITIEAMIGRNQTVQIERFVRLIGLKQLESNFFKVQIEPLDTFQYEEEVPKDVFDEYFDLRKEIADYAVHKMGQAMKNEAALQGDMMTPFQVMAEVGIAPTSFTDMLRRNVIPNEKVNGKPYIKKSDVEELKKLLLTQNWKKIREKPLRGGGIE